MVNGERLDNLLHLRQLIEGGTQDFVQLMLHDERVIYVGREAAAAAESRIIETYRIPSAMSDDIRDAA